MLLFKIKNLDIKLDITSKLLVLFIILMVNLDINLDIVSKLRMNLFLMQEEK